MSNLSSNIQTPISSFEGVGLPSEKQNIAETKSSFSLEVLGLTLLINELKKIALSIEQKNHYNYQLYNYALIQSDELISKKREELLTKYPEIRYLFDKIAQLDNSKIITNYIWDVIFDSIIYGSINKYELDYQTCPYNYNISISGETSIDSLDKKIKEILFFIDHYEEKFVQMELNIESLDSIGVDILIEKLNYFVKNTKIIKIFRLTIPENNSINADDLKKIFSFIKTLEIKHFDFFGAVFQKFGIGLTSELFLNIPNSCRKFDFVAYKFYKLSIQQINYIFSFIQYGIKELSFSFCDICEIDNEKAKVFFKGIPPTVKTLSISVDYLHKLGKQGLIDLFSSIPNTVENIYLYGTFFAYIGDYNDTIEVLKSFHKGVKFMFIGNNGLEWNGDKGEGSQNALFRVELKKLASERGIKFFGKEIRDAGDKPFYFKKQYDDSGNEIKYDDSGNEIFRKKITPNLLEIPIEEKRPRIFS